MKRLIKLTVVVILVLSTFAIGAEGDKLITPYEREVSARTVLMATQGWVDFAGGDSSLLVLNRLHKLIQRSVMRDEYTIILADAKKGKDEHGTPSCELNIYYQSPRILYNQNALQMHPEEIFPQHSKLTKAFAWKCIDIRVVDQSFTKRFVWEYPQLAINLVKNMSPAQQQSAINITKKKVSTVMTKVGFLDTKGYVIAEYDYYTPVYNTVKKKLLRGMGM